MKNWLFRHRGITGMVLVGMVGTTCAYGAMGGSEPGGASAAEPITPPSVTTTATPARTGSPGVTLGAASAAARSAAAAAAAAARPVAADAWRTTGNKRAALAALDARSSSASVRVTTVRDIGGHPVLHTVTVSPATARTLLTAAAADPAVVTDAIDSRMSQTTITGGDPGRSQQWALTALQAETAWSRHTAAGVTVAVVDTGVQASHPDLAGVVLPGTDLVTSGGGNGSADGNGHGTHVAGIIDAVAGNGIGVAGLAQGAKILPVKVLDDTGSGWSSTIAKGIVWAADNGADVINLSLGGTTADPVLQSAVSYALGKGVTVAAAAGNERTSGDPVEYPAAFPGVIAVGATDATGAVASFSETGSFVTLTAPGVNILSTYKGGLYAFMSGTSMATPYVAATAALLKAADPTLTPARVAATLTATATSPDASGRDDSYGAGIVDPVAALCAVGFCGSTTTSPTTSPTASPTTSPSTSPGASGTIQPGVLTVTSAPTSIGYGSPVSVSAVLTAGGTPVAGAPVRLCARSGGTTTCSTATTTASGRVTASAALTASGSVRLVFAGSSTVAATSTVDLPVTVTSRVSVTSGGKGTLAATVRPVLGQPWILQRRSGQTWASVSTGTLPTAGSSVTVTFGRLPAGTYRFAVGGTTAVAVSVTGPVAVS